MSTTPMHRPFLVSQDSSPRTAPRRGLHLVPAPKRRKSLILLRGGGLYTIAAATVALLLVLTIY